MTLRFESWKSYYAAERAELGEAGLIALFEDAPRVVLRAGGAIVFPHTRLRVSGAQVAAAASAVIESDADRVLAIGVRHGARDGGESARGIYDAVADEFSLDNFRVLLELAARRAGKKTPELIVRFPFLVGGDPSTLPRIEEIGELARTCAVVATTDPIHYGIGYGDKAAVMARESEEARRYARDEIEYAFSVLAELELDQFAEHAARVKSDFRDVGPVLATVLGRGFRFAIKSLELVDYAEVLGAPKPTWVAAALVECSARSSKISGARA
jgi:predicted class III extradiol MEMO1 family dioxygenase